MYKPYVNEFIPLIAGIHSEVVTLLKEARAFTGRTYADTTRASYKTHFMAYLRFCIKFKLDPVPATQSTILAYTTFLARSLKPTSINNYLNIIRILHLDAGLENPLSDNFALANLKRGIARELGSPPDQKLPITCKILSEIHDQLCFLLPKDIVFWAACMVGFFGLLRKKTLLPQTSNNHGDSCLLRSDFVMLDVNSFVLNVRKTKTIQCSERVLVLPYVSSPGSKLCPVSAMKDLLYVAPREGHLPLFSYKTNGTFASWTHSSFTTKLKQCISNAGYNATKYSGHSFRRGGATLGFELGMSIPEIKVRGDWRSSAVNEYIVVHDVRKIADVLISGAAKLY